MKSPASLPPSGLGLSVSQYFSLLPRSALRSFIDADVLSLLSTTFGGRVSTSRLQKTVTALVDFETLLSSPRGRRLVFSGLPEKKRSELESRVGRSVTELTSSLHDDSPLDRHAACALLEFFGILGDDETDVMPLPRLPIDTARANYGLFDHQRDAMRRVIPLLDQGDRRAILHMPTGTGKTRTAMHVVAHTLRRHEPSVVVWLSSSTELLDQAVVAFEEAWAHLGSRTVRIGKMWGASIPDLDEFSDGFLAVGLAKGWTAQNITDPDWALRMSKKIRLVIFDEAHQSIAPTHRYLVDGLTLHAHCALLGLTATPGRTWSDITEDSRLSSMYGGNKIALRVPNGEVIDFLTSHGYLARTEFRTLLAEPGPNITPADHKRIARSLDIPTDIVTAHATRDAYMSAVFVAIKGLMQEGHRRILLFAASVKQANVLNAILVAHDIRSDVISAETRRGRRDRAIKDFRSPVDDGAPMVLLNYGVLTTGFDAPTVTAVIVARPTKSLVLFSQMIGRATRGPQVGGTDRCVIVTVVDPRLPGFGDVASAFHNWEEIWES